MAMRLTESELLTRLMRLTLPPHSMNGGRTAEQHPRLMSRAKEERLRRARFEMAEWWKRQDQDPTPIGFDLSTKPDLTALYRPALPPAHLTLSTSRPRRTLQGLAFRLSTAMLRAGTWIERMTRRL